MTSSNKTPAINGEKRDSEETEKAQEPQNCCRKCLDVFSFVPKNATPPNWGILWLVFISLFSSSFTLTFLFPFLPEMVKSFGYSEEEKGTYVGLIASSVFAGRAAGSFFWGWLSDLKGRRLVLLITIVGNGLFSFLFGFVHSLPLAMALRFLAGLANGTVGVTKAILYDVSDNTNQAFSMSVISISWGAGLILGPAVGGYLALPADKYPSLFSHEGFFASFPFILPSFCCLVVCLVAFIAVFLKFKDPTVLKNETEVEALGVELTDGEKDEALNVIRPLLTHKISLSTSSLHSSSIKTAMSVENLHCESDAAYFNAKQESEKLSPERFVVNGTVLDCEGTPDNQEMDGMGGSLPKNQVAKTATESEASYEKKEDLIIVEMLESRSLSSEKTGKKCTYSPSSCWKALRHSSLIQLLRIRDVRDAIALYAVFSFSVIGYDDVFTIFASTSTDYDGLGFSTDEIGTALGAVSIPLLFIQLKIYPQLVAKFGIRKSYLICMFFIFIPVQVLPMLHLLANSKVWLWVGLVALTLPMRVAMNSCFAGSSLFINNSVKTDMAGKANGLGMTATAIARTLAPTIGGAMFSWSLTLSNKVGPPLDVNITFVFFGFILFINTLQCLFLSSRLDHQKK